MRPAEFLAIALAVAGLGCGSGSGIHCPSGDERCAAVDVVVANWNSTISARCSFRRTNDLDGWLISFLPHVHCERTDELPCAGYTNSSHGVIEVANGEAGQSLESTLAHEFGHTRGLKHTCASALVPSEATAPGSPPCGPDSRGIMDPDHPSSVPTDIDLAEFRRAGACP